MYILLVGCIALTMLFDMLKLEKVICLILGSIASCNFNEHFWIYGNRSEIFALKFLCASYSSKLFLGCRCNGDHNAICIFAKNDEG